MSEPTMVERLARKRHAREWEGEPDTYEDEVRWWLRAIADEVAIRGHSDAFRDNDVGLSLVVVANYLATEADR